MAELPPRCLHAQHHPPRTGGTLAPIEASVDGDKLLSVFEYTCPGCGQKTRITIVTKRAAS